jgi:hypothetical protein
MLTPIRPSLSQALLRQGNPVQPVQAGIADSKNPALEAQRAFFRQALGPTPAVPSQIQRPSPMPGLQTQSLREQIDAKSPQRAELPRALTPGVFKAADVQQARINTLQNSDAPAPLRPGSLLNIVV